MRPEHPRLALARELAQKTPSIYVFGDILGALIERPGDRLAPWPNDETLLDAVMQIDLLLNQSWPWHERASHGVIYYREQPEKIHPTTRLVRKLTFSRRTEGRSPNTELRAIELGSLHSLTLSNLEFTVSLSNKPHLQMLRELWFYDVHVTDAEWNAMSTSAHLACIESLTLIAYHFSSDTLTTVLNGALTRNATHLALRSGTIPGSRLAELLSHRSTLGRIRSLSLEGNDLHDWDVQPLLDARWLDNLHELDLRCRNLRYISPEAQDRLRNCPQFANTHIIFDAPKPSHLR
jgi:hypothetical protein